MLLPGTPPVLADVSREKVSSCFFFESIYEEETGKTLSWNQAYAAFYLPQSQMGSGLLFSLKDSTAPPGLPKYYGKSCHRSGPWSSKLLEQAVWIQPLPLMAPSRDPQESRLGQEVKGKARAQQVPVTDWSRAEHNSIFKKSIPACLPLTREVRHQGINGAVPVGQAWSHITGVSCHTLETSRVHNTNLTCSCNPRRLWCANPRGHLWVE